MLLDLAPTRPWVIGGRYLPPLQLWALLGTGRKTRNGTICLFRIFLPSLKLEPFLSYFSAAPQSKEGQKTAGKQRDRQGDRGKPVSKPLTLCSFGEEVDKHFHRILESFRLENNLKVVESNRFPATESCTNSD